MKTRILAAVAAAAVSIGVSIAVPSPAQAADTFSCPGSGRIFASATNGDLHSWNISNIGTTTISGGARTTPGHGWGGYGKILGGPGGRVYGINSTSGLWMYKYVSGAFDSTKDNIAPGQFKSYASAAWKNKITVDEIGDFYLVDNTGRLLWYRYDEATRTWPINGRIIDDGWDQFDLIVAAGPGVIWGRKASNGNLLRFRFEATSERWITHDQVAESSSDWGTFANISSPGGDVLYGVSTDGRFLTYRYREDVPSFPVSRAQLGSSTDWATFTNVLAIPNVCKLTERHIPAAPAVPVQNYSPTAAIQGPVPSGGQIGPLEFVYVDNIGSIRHGHQPDPEFFGGVQWSTLGRPEVQYTGKPALAVGAVPETDVPAGRQTVHALTHSTTGDVASFTRTTAPGWGADENLAGRMRSHPVVTRLTDGLLAAFAIDAAGHVWTRRQTSVRVGAFLGWRDLGGSLTGELTVVPIVNGGAVLFGLDADGTPVTATYRAGVLSAWAELGGSGFTGTVSVVSMPGQILRAFARDADGRVQTQLQVGGVFPGTWSPVGDLTVAGSPAAVLDPALGRVAVVARGTDNELYRVFETAQGSNTWDAWQRVNTDGSDPSFTDPTILQYAGGAGPTWAILFRNENNGHRFYTRSLPGGKKAGAVTFKAHTLPAPPR
ncbi:tachylectin-related carbohydrate-binding protein [Actinoplanes sp. NBRC 103695]|uniref:tachylectin-related carbohydrate-binding protein n=1 Tax=Actinoplanes sp. NBRC 103695 TaxID=3032202 RepID=UPI0024A1BC3C|nr:tachylectin-related carbohydrate-binding protein [Actinoplanes sp. NBRC 103695]GLY93184.1 hypothetical protein Acsp02_04400 [Actinoplanes sp. NBRC 103695]